MTRRDLLDDCRWRRVCARRLRRALAASPEQDWNWLVGNWDVWHRRLKERLAGSNDWQEFGGKSAFWLTMGGLGTIDDNIVELPGGDYRGLTIRAFDPATASGRSGGWTGAIADASIRRWSAGSTATRRFVGRDNFKGRPIAMRFRWLDIHGRRPNWEQAFSTDGGATWEVNWRNYFTRTSAAAATLAAPRTTRQAATGTFSSALAGRATGDCAAARRQQRVGRVRQHASQLAGARRLRQRR